MLKYNPSLKPLARRLRADMTNSEQLLWSKLRRKQVLGVRFYRQKPIGRYVVDFYAPAARWWWRWTARSTWTMNMQGGTRRVTLI